MAEPAADLDALAGGLASAIGRLRRSLNRQVHAASDAPPLPEAQLEIVRLVHRRPGLRIHDAAAELGLAPNTVSTLVRRLSDAGLLERLADPGDARATLLRLSPAGEWRLQRWRDRRGEILAGRLVDLDGADRLAIARALPVLERIALALEAVPTVVTPAPGQSAAAVSAAPASAHAG
jgi:DNA-binding MarR family transcriptional regulator